MSSEPVQTAVPAVDVTGKRIVAALIDIVLLAVVFLIMAALFGESEAETEDGGANFSVNLIVFGYYLVMESLTGQTVGKKLMGLRVAAVDGSLTWGKVALRTIIRIVDGLPVFYLVGFIAMMVSKNRQRLGDMAAGTVVVPV